MKLQRRSCLAAAKESHILLAAETGSGKTLAYAAPLLTKLLKKQSEGEKAKGMLVYE